jgi:AAHS family 4-hydroxybenzoate transporter-like MFS transporter
VEKQATVVDTDDVINASRITALQIMVGVMGALILVVDGYVTQVISYVAPQIAREWSIPREVLGWILAADKFGLVIGYLAVAPLSGYFGHKRVSTGCVLLFGVMALLTTTASNTVELFLLRLVTGIGLGGAIPSGVALTGEYFPKWRRSTAITFIFCGLSLGQFGSGEVTNLVLQPYGWQAPFLIGGAASIIMAVLLAAALPDSLEYLVNRGGKPEHAAAILRRIDPSLPQKATLVAGARTKNKLTVAQLLPQLFQSGRTFGTLVIWLAIGMNLIANTSLQTWLTEILLRSGFDQSIAIRATGMAFIAGIVSAFIIGPLMDRFGPYRVTVALFICAAVFRSLLGLSLSFDEASLILMAAFAAGFCTSSIQKAHNALSVYFYPVALRSTGLGWGLGIGRFGAIIGPILFGYLLGALEWSPTAVFCVTAIPLLVGGTGIFLMSRRYGEEAPEQRVASAAPPQAKASQAA